MTTCMRCGADAVDATGVCRVCGWVAPTAADQPTHVSSPPSYAQGQNAGYPPMGPARMPQQPGASPSPNGQRFGPSASVPGMAPGASGYGADAFHDDVDSVPSLGATRAAPAQRGPNAPDISASTNAAGGYQPQGMGAGLPPVAAPGYPATSTRFCGNCGARIEPGKAFCGQCGTPVSASAVGTMDERTSRVAPVPNYAAEYPTEYPSDNGQYRVGSYQPWDDDVHGDSPTEMFDASEMPHRTPYGRGGQFETPGGMYGGMGALHARSGAPGLEPPTGSGRTMRIVLGLICLLGSVISAVAAIVVALANFH